MNVAIVPVRRIRQQKHHCVFSALVKYIITKYPPCLLRDVVDFKLLFIQVEAHLKLYVIKRAAKPLISLRIELIKIVAYMI